MRHKIVLFGCPVAQTRMRMSNRGGFSRLYDPKAKEKESIRLQMMAQKPEKLFEHPHISFLFYLPIPDSLSKKQKVELMTENYRHEKKPDVDNFIKLYLDCMDGIFFEGDQKISIGAAYKIYSENPRTVIEMVESKAQVEIDPRI